MDKKIFLLCFLFSLTANAQIKLTLNDAIKIALEKNYDIRLAKEDVLLSENNYSVGNAGFLPKVDLSASKTRTVNNTKQEYSTGQSVDKKNAGSNSTNAGIALSWTIFDGLKMFTTLSKLKEYKELGEINLRKQIENSVYDVIKNYYEIVRQKQNYKTALENISVSEERLKIANEKFAVGSASKFDVLRAQVDLNADKSNLLNQEILLSNLKTTLNNLLAFDPNYDFDVEDSIYVDDGLSFQKIKEIAFERNTSLIQAEKFKTISSYDVNSTYSEFLPRITLNTGYNYLQSIADAGLVKSNKSYGYNYGISLSWNLFNGFNSQLAYENAKINFDKNIIYLEAIKNDIETALITSYKNYKKNLELLALEKSNVEVAKENLDLAFEELKLGSISPIEFREVQKNYFNSQSRLINAFYIAKVGEIDLLKQSGIIVKN
ncbi:MAG: TolC family protein [Melioribacteraceae bacterium]|nr:TolC family protein [Melioribacteraceae bacterium]